MNKINISFELFLLILAIAVVGFIVEPTSKVLLSCSINLLCITAFVAVIVKFRSNKKDE